MKKQLLLTGGNGFIGKNIRESFLAQKYDITAPRSSELNLADTEAVDNYFKTHQFDAVIHAAVKPGHRNAKDPTNLLYTNLRMFENLARHTDRFGRLINLGSGAVYDTAADNRQVTEDQIGLRMGKDDHPFYAVFLSTSLCVGPRQYGNSVVCRLRRFSAVLPSQTLLAGGPATSHRN